MCIHIIIIKFLWAFYSDGHITHVCYTEIKEIFTFCENDEFN